MSKSLYAFLNPESTGNEEVIVSKRFKENGEIVNWEIKPVTSSDNDRLMKRHIKVDKRGNQTFNRVSYMNELVASSVVFPDLKNAELQNAYGAMGESDLLSKMLLVGEFATLSEAVQRISGLQSDEDPVEEAKN